MRITGTAPGNTLGEGWKLAFLTAFVYGHLEDFRFDVQTCMQAVVSPASSTLEKKMYKSLL
jgi:hypothetical protein